MPASYLIYNGQFYPSDALLISPDNRSFRYGDGFFETMKMIDGKVILKESHMQRLFYSLELMQFDKPDYFTSTYILEQIQALVSKNNHQQLARVRLMIFRGNGGLYDVEDNQPNYVIQSWKLSEFPMYNVEGLTIGIYKDARKTIDAFSAIKSNNYLPYAMASIWCKRKGFDDAVIMNCYDRITEATISNVFIMKGGVVQTPPLSEGCINGVTRRYLLQYMKDQNIAHEEKKITPEEVLQADELFLTNAGFYIRWVKQCNEKVYNHTFSLQLFEKAITSLINKEKGL